MCFKTFSLHFRLFSSLLAPALWTQLFSSFWGCVRSLMLSKDIKMTNLFSMYGSWDQKALSSEQFELTFQIMSSWLHH